jgi:hypothetical protein
MTRGALVAGAFLSLLWLPWFCTAGIAVMGALFVPLLPAALGVLYDALYGAPHGFPLATALGAVCTAGALFVRTRLRTGIIPG